MQAKTWKLKISLWKLLEWNLPLFLVLQIFNTMANFQNALTYNYSKRPHSMRENRNASNNLKDKDLFVKSVRMKFTLYLDLQIFHNTIIFFTIMLDTEYSFYHCLLVWVCGCYIEMRATIQKIKISWWKLLKWNLSLFLIYKYFTISLIFNCYVKTEYSFYHCLLAWMCGC